METADLVTSISTTASFLSFDLVVPKLGNRPPPPPSLVGKIILNSAVSFRFELDMEADSGTVSKLQFTVTQKSK